MHNNELGDHYLNTIVTVFPNTYFLDYDHMIYSFKNSFDREEMKNKITQMPQSDLVELAKSTIFNMKKIDFKVDDGIFTDDFAPIEKLTFEVLNK